jgi:malate dehydrogenase
MRVSVVGAGGDVGRAFAAHLLRSRLLGPSDELQLVGHGTEHTERMLLAVRVDLLDAFDETAPAIAVASSVDDVRGDVIVMAAGATISPERPSRRDLAEANRAAFEQLGDALARSGSGREVVVVVSNPVELAVAILARRLDRRRVLGMGAQQDSLRFARAIAADAELARQRVHAWVLGEHGDAIVPLWSDVRITGLDPDRLRATVARSRGAHALDELDRAIAAAREHAFALVAKGRIRDAYGHVEALPPDLRITIEPFLTVHCLHSSVNATANATLDLVRALASGRDSVVGAQVQLAGELGGIETVVGVPVIVNAGGWSQVVCPPLAADEQRQLARAAGTIAANLAAWTSGAPAQAGA